MVTIYYSPSCSSCRKVMKWFDEQNLEYRKKDIFSGTLTKEDIMDIITKSENGTDDIISPRSKIVKENNIDFDEMKLSELIDFIMKNPSILRRPIIVDDRRIQVGYNSEDITTFIPYARHLAEMSCNSNDCPMYGKCDPSLDHLGKLKIKR